MSSNMEQLLLEYKGQLNSIEQIVLKIAQEHLETSFSLEQSIGFKIWNEARKQKELKQKECLFMNSAF
jgi:hypothetical protein